MTLPDDSEIHLWVSAVLRPPTPLPDLYDSCSPSERALIDKMGFEGRRSEYLLSRGLLRLLLARYLGTDPSALEFGQLEHGKPVLSNPVTDITFSISHSAGVVAHAFARGRRIGVDIEQLRPGVGVEDIARRHFTATEKSGVLALPEPARTEAFFNCWTRKEAFLKATGDGLSGSLTGVEVSFQPGDEARIVSVDGNREAAANWSMLEIKPAHDYVGVVVAEGAGCRLRVQPR